MPISNTIHILSRLSISNWYKCVNSIPEFKQYAESEEGQKDYNKHFGKKKR